MSAIVRGESIQVELPHIGVRFNAIEEMVATLEDPHPLITPGDIAARATLTVPTSSFGGFRHKTWMVRSADDVVDVANGVANHAIETGIPAFKALSSAEQVLAILSADDDRARSYSAPDEVRAKKAVALAFLLHGREPAKQLADVKMNRLHGESLSTFKQWWGRFMQSLLERASMNFRQF